MAQGRPASFNVQRGAGGGDMLAAGTHQGQEQEQSIRGVTVMYSAAIQARTEHREQTCYGNIAIRPSAFEDSAWKSLPISRVIGLPILYRKDPSNDSTKQSINSTDLGFRGPKRTHQGDTNKAFELFAVDVDPASPTYGKPTDSADCDVQFMREDRKDLEAEHVEALRMYTMRCQKFVFQRRLSSAEDAATPFTISPKSFFECFKMIQHLEARQKGNLAWAIPFPGQHDKPICEGCCKEASSDKVLLQCGKCKGVWYCGMECQREDWKLHKHMCKAT